ncbi:MAG TPA: sigma-70 family RNA polymerase sigma factor, partial [Flavobacteriaceae bacterium]|nr:sigma-70 family RNA polymerase sigma factor [Flavobacteriaceae bacterium]
NKKAKLMNVDISELQHKQVQTLSTDNYFTGDEIQIKLQEAIATLPQKQQLVFNMKYFDEMKYKQMATILETSVGALKASYHIATKKIEAFLKNN